MAANIGGAAAGAPFRRGRVLLSGGLADHGSDRLGLGVALLRGRRRSTVGSWVPSARGDGREDAASLQ
jgi:hypothetical protein